MPRTLSRHRAASADRHATARGRMRGSASCAVITPYVAPSRLAAPPWPAVGQQAQRLQWGAELVGAGRGSRAAPRGRPRPVRGRGPACWTTAARSRRGSRARRDRCRTAPADPVIAVEPGSDEPASPRPRPEYFHGYPLVLTPTASRPVASQASTLTVPYGSLGAAIAGDPRERFLAIAASRPAAPLLGVVSSPRRPPGPPATAVRPPVGERLAAARSRLVGEPLGARPRQQQVLWQPLHDGPRDRHRVRESRGHGGRPHRRLGSRRPSSPASSSTSPSRLGRSSTPDVVVFFVGLHQTNRDLDRVQGSATGPQSLRCRRRIRSRHARGDHHRAG